ncbi:hypothetical protein L7F22_035580 [Adiantum nelumboides]|nr:hypothetical protein [Adiantum nelumboides]
MRCQGLACQLHGACAACLHQPARDAAQAQRHEGTMLFAEPGDGLVRQLVEQVQVAEDGQSPRPRRRPVAPLQRPHASLRQPATNIQCYMSSSAASLPTTPPSGQGRASPACMPPITVPPPCITTTSGPALLSCISDNASHIRDLNWLAPTPNCC